jgi:hypothetical protein
MVIPIRNGISALLNGNLILSELLVQLSNYAIPT